MFHGFKLPTEIAGQHNIAPMAGGLTGAQRTLWRRAQGLYFRRVETKNPFGDDTGPCRAIGCRPFPWLKVKRSGAYTKLLIHTRAPFRR